MKKYLLIFIIFILGLIIVGCETETTKNCRIIYNGNGITGGERPVDTKNYNPGQKAVVMVNTFTKTGHTFKYWNTHWRDTGDSYTPGNEIVIPDQNIVHLYAIWEKNN